MSKSREKLEQAEKEMKSCNCSEEKRKKISELSQEKAKVEEKNNLIAAEKLELKNQLEISKREKKLPRSFR